MNKSLISLFLVVSILVVLFFAQTEAKNQFTNLDRCLTLCKKYGAKKNVSEEKCNQFCGEFSKKRTTSRGLRRPKKSIKPRELRRPRRSTESDKKKRIQKLLRPSSTKRTEKTMSDSSSTGINSEALWDRYRQALFYFIKRKSDGDQYVGLQMVTDQLEANWDRYPEQLSLVADRVSAYGTNFAPTTLSFNKQYDRFLNNLNILDSSVSQADRDAKRSLDRETDDLLDELDMAEFKCSDDYEQMKPYLGSTSYLQFQSQFCPNIADFEFKLKRLNGRLMEMRTKVNGKYADAFNAINDYMLAGDRGQYTDYGSLKRFITNAKQNKATSFSISVKSGIQINEKREWVKKKKSGFLFFKKSSSQTRVEYRFQEEYFQMSISAAGYGAIQVYPSGNWFKASILNKYKSPAHYMDQSIKFFGDGGSLALLPHTYHVLYQPKVTLNLSKRDGVEFMQNSQSSFSFGPFSSNKSSSMTVKKLNEDNYAVEFNVNSDSAVIVAVDNHAI